MSLLDDCAALQEAMLQWMSESPTARPIDSELGDLRGNVIGGVPLLSYARYNAGLRRAEVEALLGDTAAIDTDTLTAMDAPDNMEALHRIGIAAGRRDVMSAHFPAAFNLE
jgi:hypothetical protein